MSPARKKMKVNRPKSHPSLAPEEANLKSDTPNDQVTLLFSIIFIYVFVICICFMSVIICLLTQYALLCIYVFVYSPT